MKVSKLGVANFGIAVVAQVIWWSYSWTKTARGDDTTIVEAALGIAWNLIPYGYALALSCWKKHFEPLNIISSFCILILVLLYWDAAGLGLAFWPIWHTIGLIAVSAWIALGLEIDRDTK